jgi:Tfp pilus assembly protein PilO
VSRTLQILVAVGLTAAAAAAYWYLALAPKRDEVAKLDTEIAQTQTSVQTAESTAANYEATRKAYSKNYATVVRLGKAVPADDDVRSLVVQLDASAERAKIDFSNIALTDVGAAPGGAANTAAASSSFVTQPFSFAFQGSFFRLSDFFNQLDRFVQVNGDNVDVTGRLLRIETFKLTPQGETPNSLKAEIGATSYSLPQSEGLTAGATAQGPAGGTAATPSSPATAASATTPTTTATAGVVR